MIMNTTPPFSIRWHATASATLILLLMPSISVAGSLSVYTVGVVVDDAFTLPSELHRFSEDGTVENRWDIPTSRFATSMTTDGTSLFVGEFTQAIQRYDLNGMFLGEFADVSSLAGPDPGAPNLESDAAGNIYASYTGSFSQPRTSFRLGPDGSITGTYAHPDLVFPDGIDATADGTVYIVNGANLGAGLRLFKFDSSGGYLADFAIPETSNPSDIAINETSNELLIADEGNDSIHIYDISSATPTYSQTISGLRRTFDVFTDPMSGRIFGVTSTFENDVSSRTGYEVARDGTIVNSYFEDAPLDEQTITGIVALVVPEPGSMVLLVLVAGMLLRRCSPSDPKDL